MTPPTQEAVAAFQQHIYDYYHAHGRHDLPWRGTNRLEPYSIMVSELMLQQTQVSRVIPKYEQFLAVFPSVQALAKAQLSQVLTLWSGLGYNRRAKFLWQAAQMVVKDYDGNFPSTQAELTKLPGVGINTAGAIAAYSFNKQVVFLETNIRTVFIHHFFNDSLSVSDKDLLPIVKSALDEESPRDWYWALMDYGTHLKKTIGNASTLSAHYKKQATFKGSKRQVRGQVIRILTERPKTLDELRAVINDDRLDAVLSDLTDEAMITKTNGVYSL